MTAPTLHIPGSTALLALLVLITPPVMAETPSDCPVLPEAFWPTLRSLPSDVIDMEADFVETIRNERIHARGDVRLFAEGRRIDTEQLDFFVPSRLLELPGPTRLYDGELLLEAREGHFRIDEDRGAFSDVAYWLRMTRARGDADRVIVDDPDRVRLDRGRYTTCPEGDDSWWLSAGRVRLDQTTGRGYGHNVTVRFKNVPIFYTPYINFPIDDRRQSGLLAPSVGYSSKTGLDLALPWYWNIAPNYDATLTPRLISERGLMLDSEWRYLRPAMRGTLDLAYLPDDREAERDRHLIRWRHQATLRPQLRLNIDASDASDSNYFQDFGTDLFSSSVAVLERRADLTLTQPFWRLSGRVQDYQSLDPTLAPRSEPYRRLPQLLLESGRTLDSGVYGSLRAELVNFDHGDLVTGIRADVDPEIGFRHERFGYFIEPRVGLRHTRYALDNTLPGTETDLSRTVPRISVDSGLFFERRLGNGNLQTLEPRVFYGYVPFRDQDALPRFDTGERDFSFDSLFTTRRFVGADRVGDTHQVTTALTSRIVDPISGTEILSVSGGQITYLDDRRVRLRRGDPPRREGRSELAAEARARFSQHWQGRSSIMFDTERNRARLATVAVSYRPRERALINLGYRLREDRIEQTDVSAIWPVTERFQAIGRWNYSLREERDLELLAGLEYRTCCYGMQFALRRYLTDADGEYNTGVYFQLTLKGLTRFDTGLDSLLREGIAGYGTLENR